MRRVAAAAFLIGLAGLVGVPSPRAAFPAPAPARVGVLVEPWSPLGDDILAALRDAVRTTSPGARPIELVERASGATEAEIRAGLAELALEGVQVIAALGADASRIAPESVRDRAVVIVSPAPTAAGGDRVRAVATTPDPAVFAREVRRIVDLRRIAPRAPHFAVVGPTVGTADALVTALAAGAPAGAIVDRLPWVTPDQRGIRGKIEPEELSDVTADVVVASPETGATYVTDLARLLAGTGTALVGSRGDHLDAGAAVVLRPSPRDIGGLVAAALADAVAGGDGPRLRRPQRLLHEVHLGNARRLGFQVPLAVLASSDRTTAPPPVRR